MFRQIREKLADTQHQIWAKWMKYLFSVVVANEDGSVTIPPELVKRWKYQLATPYAKLSTQEKESDRHQADKVLTALGWRQLEPKGTAEINDIQEHYDCLVEHWRLGSLTEADMPQFYLAVWREITGQVFPKR